MAEEPAPKSTKVVKAAKRWVPIAVIGALLAIGGLLATYMLFVRPGGGPELTSKVPNDLDVYLEVPNVERLVVGLSSMRFLNQRKLDVDHWVKQANQELADTLELTDEEAAKVLRGVDSVAIAARVGEDSYQGALLLRFADANTARIMLSSERFFEADDEGVGGKRYLIDRKAKAADEEEPSSSGGYDPTIHPSVIQRTLFGLELRGNEVAAFFKDERLVVLGHEQLIDDVASVLKGKHSSLENNERFRKARAELPRAVAAFAFVDTQMFSSVLDYAARDKLDYFLKKPEPIVASLRFDDAGSRFSLRGGLSGKLMPPAKAYTEPAAITLPKRLPKEAVGYLALSTKMDARGAELEQMILDNVDKEEPEVGREIRREIANAERELGFRLTSVYDALGNEGIVAVMPHKSYKLDFTKAPDIAQDFAVAYVQHTSNADDAKRLVRKIQDNIFREDKSGSSRLPYRVRSEEAGGFTAEPDDPTRDPFVAVRFSGDHLVAAVGRRDVCERFWTAFTNGQDTLGDDDGHEEAIDAMPSNAHGYAWVDTGRIFEEALRANPGLEKDAQQYGFDTGAVTTIGDERVTSALSLGWSVENEVWVVKLDALNTSWQLPIAAYVEHTQDQMRARTLQAHNTVKAIASSAEAAFRANRYDWRNYTGESPDPLERLCKSASAVPATIPPRAGYVPVDDAGKDWQSGDDRTGWKCLKFSLAQDLYYQYSYTVGGGYKGPARGGPDPGPNGFEVSAEGDLDGDGKTSLFTLTGSLDPSTGTLTLATTTFVSDELE